MRCSTGWSILTSVQLVNVILTDVQLVNIVLACVQLVNVILTGVQLAGQYYTYGYTTDE